jgi:hypothetical protein
VKLKESNSWNFEMQVSGEKWTISVLVFFVYEYPNSESLKTSSKQQASNMTIMTTSMHHPRMGASVLRVRRLQYR